MDGFRKNKDIVFLLRNAKKDMGDHTFLLEKMREKLNLSEESIRVLKPKLRFFTSTLKKRWVKANYIEPRFLEQNHSWLEYDFTLLNKVLENIPRSSSGRRRNEPLEDKFSSKESTSAASSSISGKQNNVASGEPIWRTKLGVDDTLALFIHGNFTKEAYNCIRTDLKGRNVDIFPSHKSLRNAKKHCYPKSITVSDSSADVDVQTLADHTTERLFKYLDQHADCENVPETLTFSFKWGCSGSVSHYTRYNPLLDIREIVDQFLFAICMLPLVLKSNDTVLWTNPNPSSPIFCRPMRITFERYTSPMAADETKKMEQQISNLKPFTFKFRNRSITVKYEFILTTMDTETFGCSAESPDQSCSICQATTQTMNNLNVIQTLPVTIDFNQYGISNCHAWIRCMECVLNISYCLEIKTWQLQSEKEKSRYQERKQTIQDNLKEELNIEWVDEVNSDFGTTYTGDDARTFFRYYESASNATGVNEELIKRIGVVLVSLSGYRPVNPNLFKEYAMETFNLYTAKYDWYHMPSSLHKILFHGADMIKCSAVPIGMLPEKTLEEKDEYFRDIQEDNKCETLTKVFQYLLCCSDILLCSITLSRKTDRTPPRFEVFEDEVKKLMLPEDLDSEDDC